MKLLIPILGLILGLSCFDAWSQCSALRQQRNITFNTDKDCAPVSVTDFTITYFFNVPQDPNDVQIRFEWNDPLGTSDTYGAGDPGFLVDATNTEFTATGTFTYPEDENCVFEPASYISVAGDLCETSEQLQLVTSWADDNSFGGVMDIDPGFFDVCYNNAVVDAVFEDNSTFNCNINQNPDAPNRQERYTQFVYGDSATHDPANSIRNLTLDDGSTVPLTDGSANLSSTETRGGVTAAYFGPIENIPFPADGPVSVSFPMSALADPANDVGNVFEVTLYNWNICNPYNGKPDNPNYNDAVKTEAYIRIVNPPVPDFQTRVGNAGGSVETVFCLGDNIYFENLSTNATDYLWEFYDDPSGDTLIATSDNVNPTFVFTNPGDKLIRLTASNADADGNCQELIEKTITLSPSAVAGIGLYDPTFTNTITPEFCSQDGTTVFTIGFRDETINVEPDTEWRWEFYDENGVLEESIPAGAGNFESPSTTDFTRDYTNHGEYLVRLTARNNTSGCESVAERTIFIYDIPDSYFESDSVCEGERTSFTGIPDSILSLNPRINGDFVEAYEWDFSYDGVSFNVERSTGSDDDFQQYLTGQNIALNTEPVSSVAGTYTVALRLRTSLGMCTDVFTRQVIVSENPGAILSTDYTEPICPGTSVNFINESPSGDQFLLVVTDSLSVNDTLIFSSDTATYTFNNAADSSKNYYVSLVAQTTTGCYSQDGPVMVEVLPTAPSGFSDPNYSVVSANCSEWQSRLVVDAATQSLDADSYTWTIQGESGVLPGYPLTKNSGEANFHELEYSLVNSGNSNQVFIATLDVIRGDICIESSQQEFLISPAPPATFSVTETDSCTYETIELIADQAGLTDYNWAFTPAPDQVFNDDERQVITYLRPASGQADLNFTATLTTENLAGCGSDTVTYNGIVEASQPALVADFSVVNDTIQLPETTIQITNLSSDYEGVIHAWDFGDGSVDTLFSPGEHNYPEPGVYRIELTVSNGSCEASTGQSVVVLPTEPIIDFVADTLEGCSPFTVSFTNLSEFADQGTFLWDFGDGKTSQASDPVHTYARAGTYTVTLYGENTEGTGSQEVKQDYITVHNAPVAAFEANPTTARIPEQEVYFRNDSRHSDTFLWDFGDGNTSMEEAPVHQYDTIGSYTIQLIAQNDIGCADTLAIPALVQTIAGGEAQVPNAFSPSLSGPGSSGGGSGEAINDVFIPNVEGVSEFRMLIYNKWGELLFESNSQETGWDGYYEGVLQPADVYVYKLELTYTDGREGIKVGDVTLVR